MKTLDKIWEMCSTINPNFKIEEKQEEIVIVRNIFKYPEKMRDFQDLLSKWESCGNAKPGLMSLKMPFWTGNHIAENVLDLKNYMPNSTECEYIYFYWNNTMKFNRNPTSLQTGNCLLPHNDPASPGDEESDSIIGLVNLNDRPVRTGFWTMNGKMYGDEETLDELGDYVFDIDESNYNQKINNGILDNVLNIEYSFNDAIFYNARLLHQPWIDKFYTRDNPRIMFRFSFNMNNDVDDDDEECYTN
jgi:hypothetical protein